MTKKRPAAKTTVTHTVPAKAHTVPAEAYTVPWWPPKAGDRLRHATTPSAGPCRIKRVDAECFDTKGSGIFRGAEFRWHYQIWDELDAFYRKIWPDGSPGWGSRRLEVREA